MKIYTDGSVIKGQRGGWAYVALCGDLCLIGSGQQKNTTNNRMELLAVIMALKEFKVDLTIYTDSKYVCCFANGTWSNKNRKKNTDLWAEFDQLIDNRCIRFEWVRGHNGNEYNELVDKIAREEARKL